jgi:hypothetical protein
LPASDPGTNEQLTTGLGKEANAIKSRRVGKVSEQQPGWTLMLIKSNPINYILKKRRVRKKELLPVPYPPNKL